MKFYTENIVKKARQLREKGFSGRKIANKLGINNTTVLRWCSDVPSTNRYHLRLKKIHDDTKNKGSDLIKDINLTPEIARLLTGIIYWCEGSRYPSSNFVSFSNSDVELVKSFLRLFRTGFKPQKNKFRVHLQLHSTHDKEKITDFWSKILKIPRSRFYKPTVTKPTKTMKRQNYKGTCTVRYYDVSVLLKLIGIYESFAKKIK